MFNAVGQGSTLSCGWIVLHHQSLHCRLCFVLSGRQKNTCFSLDGNDTKRSNCGGNNAHASVGIPSTSSYLCMCDNAQTGTNMQWHTLQRKLKHHITDSKTWLIFTMKCQRPSGPSKRWAPSQRIAHWKGFKVSMKRSNMETTMSDQVTRGQHMIHR